MAVTFSMLLEKTARLLRCAPPQVLRRRGTAPGAGIEQVLLHQKRRSGCGNTLYIAEGLPPVREGNLFCTACALPEEGWPGNLAVFPPGVTRARLFQAALSALAFFHRWEHTVLDMIYGEQGLDAIVAFAYESFQNPFLIYDSSLKVLSYTKNDGSTDRLWVETVRHGTVTGLDESSARELLLYVDRLDTCEQPFKHRSKDLTEPFYSCNIMLGGKRVGMVALMERNHEVTPGELDLLLLFCYLLTFELQKDAVRRENRGSVYNQLIHDLMEGRIAGRSVLHSRLTATRWKIHPYFHTALFVPGETFLSEPEWARAFEQLLGQTPDGHGILLDQSIFCVLSSPEPQLSRTQLELLSVFCRQYRLRCGLSDVYTDLLETHRVQNQSRLALELSQGSVVQFPEVRYQNLLSHCAGYPEPAEILHPAVAVLARHDAMHQSEYLDTLSALFDSQYNQIAAARRLHIHRTTLLYRLERLAKLTGVCLEDPDEMLFLQFSLRLYRQGVSKGGG